MGSTVTITMKRTRLQRWWHYLFHCPSFWRLRPAFTCPLCGAKYRCYWDGHDEGGYVHLCGDCARRMREGA